MKLLKREREKGKETGGFLLHLKFTIMEQGCAHFSHGPEVCGGVWNVLGMHLSLICFLAKFPGCPSPQVGDAGDRALDREIALLGKRQVHELHVPGGWWRLFLCRARRSNHALHRTAVCPGSESKGESAGGAPRIS